MAKVAIQYRLLYMSLCGTAVISESKVSSQPRRLSVNVCSVTLCQVSKHSMTM